MGLIQKFRQNATLLLDPRPSSLFDWLFIMQHYRAPTRLLDWSESPLFAMYFAINENPKEAGALWVLLPVELNGYSNIKPDFTFDIPSFEDPVLSLYNPESYENEKVTKLFPVAAISPRITSRMQAQLGVFTISHRDLSPIEDIGKKQHIWRYIIPSGSKQVIADELRLLGVNRFQLFPELQSIGDGLI